MLKTLKRNENYLISDDGEIYSKRCKKFLNPKNNHDGYLRIQLWKDGKCEFVGIHRLVAETFIENPENKSIVNHKDGNKQNNKVENLEWCTQKENVNHAFNTGLAKPKPKNWERLSKKVDQFDLYGNYIKTFPSTMEVERQLGINHANISYACKHNSRAGKYKWKYSETSNDYC